MWFVNQRDRPTLGLPLQHLSRNLVKNEYLVQLQWHLKYNGINEKIWVVEARVLIHCGSLDYPHFKFSRKS